MAAMALMTSSALDFLLCSFSTIASCWDTTQRTSRGYTRLETLKMLGTPQMSLLQQDLPLMS